MKVTDETTTVIRVELNDDEAKILKGLLQNLPTQCPAEDKSFLTKLWNELNRLV